MENSACFVFLKHPFKDSPFCLITDGSFKLKLSLLEECFGYCVKVHLKLHVDWCFRNISYVFNDTVIVAPEILAHLCFNDTVIAAPEILAHLRFNDTVIAATEILEHLRFNDTVIAATEILAHLRFNDTVIAAPEILAHLRFGRY